MNKEQKYFIVTHQVHLKKVLVKLIMNYLEEGTSFDNLTQDDINLIMSHINSYKRKKLNNVSPITMFSTIYGKDTIDKLNIREIPANDINLTSDILKK